MASILSAIAWLLRCEANDERDGDPLGGTFDDDRSSRGVQLVRVSEGRTGQMVLEFFFNSLKFLFNVFSPSTVPLIPSLPQVRKRYVKHSAMEKLVKSDKAMHKDEECYICLRPIGTKHLAKEPAAASATAAFVFSPFSKLDVEQEEENECSGCSDDESDSDRGEKGISHSEKRRGREHPERRREQHQRPQPRLEEEEEQREERRRRRRQRRESSPPRLVLELPCGHRYCECCVRRWLSSHASCPTCRYQFPERSCEVVKEP